MEYTYFEEIENDFCLMSDNCRIFNTDISPIYKDCETIRKEFYNKCSSIPVEKYGIATNPFPEMPKAGKSSLYHSTQFKLSLQTKGSGDNKVTKKNKTTSATTSEMNKNNSSSNSLSLLIKKPLNSSANNEKSESLKLSFSISMKNVKRNNEDS